MVAIADAAFPSITRTERGLTVGGRRVTLYLLEDHFRAGWPPELVKHWFNLSDREIADVLGYLQAHRSEFEREYEQVLRQAEENLQFWEQRNRERNEQTRDTALSPEVAARKALLKELRRKRHP